MSMDNIDYQIIKLLQEDGRMSVKRIAQIVSLSPPAVAERIKKLENTGIIKGYKAIIDPKKLGKNISAIIIVTMNAGQRKEFIKFAINNACILECHHVTGGFSMLVKAIFKDTSELEELVGKIQQYGNTQTLIILSSPIQYKSIL